MTKPAKRVPYYGTIPEQMEDVADWAARLPKIDTPSRRLAAAVFGEAVLDVHSANLRVHHDAREWFRSQDQGEYRCVHLCATLGFDPDATRTAMLAVKPGSPTSFRGVRNAHPHPQSRPSSYERNHNRKSYRHGANRPGSRRANS